MFDLSTAIKSGAVEVRCGNMGRQGWSVWLTPEGIVSRRGSIGVISASNGDCNKSAEDLFAYIQREGGLYYNQILTKTPCVKLQTAEHHSCLV